MYKLLVGLNHKKKTTIKAILKKNLTVRVPRKILKKNGFLMLLEL